MHSVKIYFKLVMKCDAHRISVRCELLVYSHHLLHVVKLLSHNQFTQYFVCMNIWSPREINSADAPYALVLDTSSAICAVIVSEIKIYIRSSNITSICSALSALCIWDGSGFYGSSTDPDPPHGTLHGSRSSTGSSGRRSIRRKE